MKNFKKNLSFLFLAVGVIFIWRGVWGILDLYLFPEKPLLSFAISIIFGIIILSSNDGRLNELD